MPELSMEHMWPPGTHMFAQFGHGDWKRDERDICTNPRAMWNEYEPPWAEQQQFAIYESCVCANEQFVWQCVCVMDNCAIVKYSPTSTLPLVFWDVSLFRCPLDDNLPKCIPISARNRGRDRDCIFSTYITVYMARITFAHRLRVWCPALLNE